MTIDAYISSLKAKPEGTRRRIAFWSSAGMTALIAVFWFASFSYDGSAVRADIAQTVSKAGTPAQSMTASVEGFFTEIWDYVFTPRKVTYIDVQVTPGNEANGAAAGK